jgi:LysR family cys regulon transcriptional activator
MQPTSAGWPSSSRTGDEGGLVIATTHTQARYVLPPIVGRFVAEFPKVHLTLHQGSPKEIVAMLMAGEADIGIATEALDAEPSLASFPFYEWHHGVIVPKGHPLQAQPGPVTLEELARHPIVTYHQDYTGRARIDAAFARAGFAPDVVMSALDADVIKTYVELGLGVGIVASMAFAPERESSLAMLDAQALFPSNVTRIAIRRGHYLRGYAYRFIEQCSARLTEAVVRGSVDPSRDVDLV